MRAFVLVAAVVLATVATADNLYGVINVEGKDLWNYAAPRFRDDLGEYDSGGGYNIEMTPGHRALFWHAEGGPRYYEGDFYFPGGTMEYNVYMDATMYTLKGGSASVAEDGWLAQSFTAEGESLIGFTYVLEGDRMGWDHHDITVHFGGPMGPQVGPTGYGPTEYIDIHPDVMTFCSGYVPTLPGETYAIRLGPLFSGNPTRVWAKPGEEYPGGTLYDLFFGWPQDTGKDLKAGIFHDLPFTLSVLYNNTWGASHDYAATYAQTFTAWGEYVGGVQCWISSFNDEERVDISIREWDDETNSPGAYIGPTKRTTIDPSHSVPMTTGCCWRAGEVPVVPGETYCVFFEKVDWQDLLIWEDRRQPYLEGRLYEQVWRGDPFTPRDSDMMGTIVCYGQFPQVVFSDVRVEGLTPTSAQLCFGTDVPTWARAWYGEEGGALSSKSLAYPSPLSAHTLSLTGLSPGVTYEVEAEAIGRLKRATRSERVVFTTPLVPPVQALTNGGFEDGMEGWTTYGSGLASVAGPWYRSAVPVEGARMAGAFERSAYGSGGAWQRVPAAPGGEYVLRADVLNVRLHSLASYTKARVGMDPAGGTDPSGAGVVWSAWVTNPETDFVRWFPVELSATATADHVTVFLDYDFVLTGGSSEGAWHEVAFDDLALLARSQAQSLAAGWNLVSVPLTPSVAEAGAALDELVAAGNVLAGTLYRYQPGGGYLTYPNDFTELEPGRGYWLKLTAPVPETAEGVYPERPFSVALAEGWNMVGAPGPGATPLASLLVSDGAQTKSFADAVAAGWLSPILYYYDGAYKTCAASGGDDDSLRPWRGYWLRAYLGPLELIVP